MRGPMSLEDIIDKVKKEYQVKVSMITYNTSTLYTSFGQESQKRLKMNIPEAILNVSKKALPPWETIVQLGIAGTAEQDIDCLLPDVRFYI